MATTKLRQVELKPKLRIEDLIAPQSFLQGDNINVLFSTGRLMIRLKPAAIKEIKRLQSKRPDKNLFFRLQVQPGGCSGLLYCMSFAAAVNPDDTVYDCSSVTVVLDQQSLNYIGTLTLDYAEDLMGGGFRFQNSQAIASCGCGNSFAIDTTAAQL